MMALTEIQKYYPAFLQNQGEFLLREYLQYKILELIFQSAYAEKFAFLGGTCLRLIHNNQRFSEDLDFVPITFGIDLSEKDFEAVSKIIQTGLEHQGFTVEIRNVMRAAFHCYIRFPGLLYKSGLSGHREAKILINLDTEPQGFSFKPENVFLNQFDVFTSIQTTPPDLLLSQKITAITNRRRPKGRDFFDLVFLLGKTKPNYDFLRGRLAIATPEDLRNHLLAVCEKLDFQSLAADVRPFLFRPQDAQRVKQFYDYIKTVAF